MDLTQVVIVLLVVTLFLEALAYALYAACPPIEDLHDVSSVLHGNDAHLILFVHPHEEVAVGGALDAPGFRPVTCAATCRQQSATAWLLEKVATLA